MPYVNQLPSPAEIELFNRSVENGLRAEALRSPAESLALASTTAEVLVAQLLAANSGTSALESLAIRPLIGKAADLRNAVAGVLAALTEKE